MLWLLYHLLGLTRLWDRRDRLRLRRRPDGSNWQTSPSASRRLEDARSQLRC